MSERQFRRYRARLEDQGDAGLRDRRLGKASPHRVPESERQRMLGLYREMYPGWNVRHFHDRLQSHHAFSWGYSWTKTQLQLAGLVERTGKRGPHRLKRERKPYVGMMLHQDASRAHWLAGAAPLDLVVTMDDATSEIYSAILVEEEGTDSTFRGLIETFSARGLPCSLYTDRGSHYFHTPNADGPVDRDRLTQIGRALAHLGVEHIAAYSPQARGRSERMFATLQDRLIKELALTGLFRRRESQRVAQAGLAQSAQRALCDKAGLSRRRIRPRRRQERAHRDAVPARGAHCGARQYGGIRKQASATAGKPAAPSLGRSEGQNPRLSRPELGRLPRSAASGALRRRRSAGAGPPHPAEMGGPLGRRRALVSDAEPQILKRLRPLRRAADPDRRAAPAASRAQPQ